MLQELFIDGERVRYSIQERHVVSVLGKVYIYQQPTVDDVLRIVHLGLTNQMGLRFDEFHEMYSSGRVWMSKKKGQYTLGMIYWLVVGRIREINRKGKKVER